MQPVSISPTAHRLRRRRRYRLLTALVAIAALLLYPVGSYAAALTYPGQASFAERSVGWLRDVGLGGLVNAVENWWYTRTPPSNTPPTAGDLPSRTGTVPVPASGERPPAIPAHGTTLAGEGVWVAGARQGPDVAEYTTFAQSDARHAGVVVGVAWLNQRLVRTDLFAGTKDPGGPGPTAIPDSMRGSLVAAFNSGFRLRDHPGGFYLKDCPGAPLQDGRASVVIDETGRVSIARWGRDVSMSSHVVAVRQNLDLVVDEGHPVPGLDVNSHGQWGSTRNQFQYTWRSGIGTDRAGNLIYVAGNDLTLQTLGSAMTMAGVYRGMELDIHSPTVTFNSYRPDLAGSYPTKLLPRLPGAATRYLRSDQRDFFATTLRNPPHH